MRAFNRDEEELAPQKFVSSSAVIGRMSVTTLKAGVGCLSGSVIPVTPLRTSVKLVAVYVAAPIVATMVPVTLPTVGATHTNPQEFDGM